MQFYVLPDLQTEVPLLQEMPCFKRKVRELQRPVQRISAAITQTNLGTDEPLLYFLVHQEMP